MAATRSPTSSSTCWPNCCAAIGGRRLVVTADGAHFNRHDIGRWLSREMAARGAGLTSGDTGPALWMFCIDTAFYFALTDRTANDAPERNHAQEGTSRQPAAGDRRGIGLRRHAHR